MSGPSRSLTELYAAGEPVEALIEAAAEADLIAVGCRMMWASKWMLMGSTSQVVARWSPVPVVVVPEAWMQPHLATSPVVAGVRPVDPDEGRSRSRTARCSTSRSRAPPRSGRRSSW